ncbi:hypothetical protein F4859DRAFT_165218 [Xylaria cf. heliscus]|nr:hypothetical protein F4859DRAFT_165218 [Xylaria cf. heliscus]
MESSPVSVSVSVSVSASASASVFVSVFVCFRVCFLSTVCFIPPTATSTSTYFPFSWVFILTFFVFVLVLVLFLLFVSRRFRLYSIHIISQSMAAYYVTYTGSCEYTISSSAVCPHFPPPHRTTMHGSGPDMWLTCMYPTYLVTRYLTMYLSCIHVHM